jgi:hypothetical protein
MRQQMSGFEKFRFVSRALIAAVFGIAGLITLFVGPLLVAAIFIFAAITFALPATPVFSKNRHPGSGNAQPSTTDPGATE